MRGHIRKRGKRWALVIPLGRDPATGKPRQKWYSHRTRGEADAHLTQILGAMQGGGWTPPTKMLIREQWLRDYAAGAVGPVTMRNYSDIVRVHLVPALGHVPLSLLSAQAIQGYMSHKLQGRRSDRGEWAERPLSPASVHKHYRVLREALGHAVRWGVLARNPAVMADPPKPRRREVGVWDEEQVRLFLAAAKRTSRYHSLYLTAILTGMRAGELAGLSWQAVDLTVGVASVRQTFYRLGGQQIVKAPKTAASRRAIALPAAVVEALRAVRADQEENRRLLGADYHDQDLVFCQPDGKPLHMHNVARRDFRETIKAAGIPRLRFHDLRHLHASYLARAGVTMKVAQERLGHSTPGFTMNVYTHVLVGQQEAAARAVEGYLMGRFSSTSHSPG